MLATREDVSLHPFTLFEIITLLTQTVGDIHSPSAPIADTKSVGGPVGTRRGRDGDYLYGDGVNVATRLQELAEPDGVCVSGTVFEHVSGKINVAFNDIGERKVKNIAKPVRAYGWTNSIPPPVSAATWTESGPPLPDKPSIAVLPFANMSADPEQEFFSDGITDHIITPLSKISDLLVVARNSTLTYKGKAVDVKQVSREQGVRFVLEGSVRHHVWAERYDGSAADIFDIQDEIARKRCRNDRDADLHGRACHADAGAAMAGPATLWSQAPTHMAATKMNDAAIP